MACGQTRRAHRRNHERAHRSSVCHKAFKHIFGATLYQYLSVENLSLNTNSIVSLPRDQYWHFEVNKRRHRMSRILNDMTGHTRGIISDWERFKAHSITYFLESSSDGEDATYTSSIGQIITKIEAVFVELKAVSANIESTRRRADRLVRREHEYEASIMRSAPTPQRMSQRIIPIHSGSMGPDEIRDATERRPMIRRELIAAASRSFTLWLLRPLISMVTTTRKVGAVGVTMISDSIKHRWWEPALRPGYSRIRWQCVSALPSLRECSSF